MQARITTKRAKSRAKPMHHSVPAWSPPARNLNISSECLPSGLGLRPLRPCMLARPAVPSLCSLCSLFSTPACSQSYTIPIPHAGGSPPVRSPRLPQHVSRNTSPATRRPGRRRHSARTRARTRCAWPCVLTCPLTDVSFDWALTGPTGSMEPIKTMENYYHFIL